MTIKDNKFALELFVANHNADSEDQLEIIKDIPYIPKTVAILATTNGKIEQYIDFEKPLQPQTLWFIANCKVYRHLDKIYQKEMTITDNGFYVAVKNNHIFLKPIGTKDIYVTVEQYTAPKQIILKSNGVKTIIENSDKDDELEVTKRCSKKATYDDLNETIRYLQHKIQCN
jgi:hypothetical protein